MLYKNFRKTGVGPSFFGPLKLVASKENGIFIIQNLNDNTTKKVHYDQIIKFKGKAKQTEKGGIIRKRQGSQSKRDFKIEHTKRY